MRSNLGHRQRVKQRFRDEGLDHFEESHALELLLFYAVPRRDTKPLARRLLDTFGSFSKVLEADKQALCRVDGVGESVATYIKLLHASSRYYQTNHGERPERFTTTAECGNFLVDHFHGFSNERVYLMCLNANSELICIREIAQGTVTSADVSTRKVVEAAVNAGAVSVVLSHNHPGGMDRYSDEDVLVTRRLGKALAALEIVLVDHIIVANNKFVSLAALGVYDYRELLRENRGLR